MALANLQINSEIICTCLCTLNLIELKVNILNFKVIRFNFLSERRNLHCIVIAKSKVFPYQFMVTDSHIHGEVHCKNHLVQVHHYETNGIYSDNGKNNRWYLY